MNIRHFFSGFSLSLLLVITGCKRQNAGAFARSESTKPETPTAPLSADSELAAINADTNDVQRLHRLTLWVESHDPQHVARAAKHATGELRGALFWLFRLKLADLNPNANDETLARLVGDLLQTNDNPRRQDLREELLALAKTSPNAAFERIATTRIHPNRRNEIANAILAQVTAESPERALALLPASPGDQRDGLNAIIAAWTKKDAQAALKWTLSLPVSAYNRLMADRVLKMWSQQDPTAAVEYISTLPVTPDNRYMFSELIGNWIRQSPDESATWIQNNHISDPVVVRAALLALGESHPQLVAKLLQSPLTFIDRGSYSRRLAASWTLTDPVAARAWIDSLPLSPNTLWAMGGYVSSLASKDAEAAKAYYASLPKDIYTGAIAAQIGRNIELKPAALQWLLAQPDNPSVRDAISDVIGDMEFKKAADMLSLLGEIPEGPRQVSVYQAAAERWFSDDPIGAANWAAGITNPEALKAVINHNMAAWLNNAPEHLAALMASLPDNAPANEKLSDFVLRWTKRDPIATSDWLVKNPSVKLNDWQVHNIFQALAKNAPDTLAQKIAALPAGQMHQMALYGALLQMAKTFPQAAVDLFTQHAASKEQETLMGVLAGNWAKTDPAAAIAWTTAQPASPARDNGYRQIIYSIAYDNPQRALALSAMASTPDSRENLVVDVINAVHSHDSAAALTLLDTVNLSSVRREKLRKTLTKR